jgi:nucleotide-binding universal stress UspA family protein
MHKILFPIDGSDHAKATMHWAARFLDNLDSSIYLLIVAESLDIDYSTTTMERILHEAKTWLENCGFHVEKTDYQVNRKASDAICAYARQELVDYIIIGSHGNAFAQMFVGSVSREVMEKASQPVLVIKNTRVPTMDISSPVQFHLTQCPPKNQVLKVLMPVDNALSATTLMPLMEGLLDKKLARILLLNVVNIDSENVSLANMRLDDADKILSENTAVLEAQGFQVQEAAHRVGDPVQEICRYADEKSIDQIALISRNRSNIEKFLFGSTSTGLLRQANQPVLVFGIGPKAVLSISHAHQVQLFEESDIPS